ncbi:hypothetical protein [Shewanella waksmanii]|uniref:hypothetical protein n=1 Tax=Shewanella waksmanii TaxID=213783 RepID=UPI0004ADDC60|nr:hypothetical protein [Shewanella waksmanii]
MKPLAKTLSMAMILLTATLSTGVQAEIKTNTMETMTVTYRDPVNYALYLYTQETLALQRWEVEQGILDDAREISTQLAANYLNQDDKQVSVATSRHLTTQRKSE